MLVERSSGFLATAVATLNERQSWRQTIVYMLPKYHCEYNPIECVWGQLKRYARAYCKYGIINLGKSLTHVPESATVE